MDTIPKPVLDYVLDEVAERDPDTLFVIAEDSARANAIASNASADCRLTHCRPEYAHAWLANNTRCDLAVITDTLEAMMRADAEQLLGRLRDFNAGGVLAVIDIHAIHDTADALWQQSDLIALGFSRCAGSRDLADGWLLYRYDIHDYKRTPSWLNARYWANPERWGKKRW